MPPTKQSLGARHESRKDVDLRLEVQDETARATIAFLQARSPTSSRFSTATWFMYSA